jgi:hypothetical protein
VEKKTYTKAPVTNEARKVPNIANVTIAPKFEKKGFCKNPHYHKVKQGVSKRTKKNYNSTKEKKL